MGGLGQVRGRMEKEHANNEVNVFYSNVFFKIKSSYPLKQDLEILYGIPHKKQMLRTIQHLMKYLTSLYHTLIHLFKSNTALLLIFCDSNLSQPCL